MNTVLFAAASNEPVLLWYGVAAAIGVILGLIMAGWARSAGSGALALLLPILGSVPVAAVLGILAAITAGTGFSLFAGCSAVALLVMVGVFFVRDK